MVGGLVAVVAGVLFVVLAALLVPWGDLPRSGDAVPARSVFSAAEIARGERVSGALRHTGWAGLAVGLIVSCVLGFTRLGPGLVRRLRGPWWLRVVLGALVVMVIGTLATLPFAWHGQRVRLDNDLSREPWGEWLVDQGLGLLVSWVMTAVALVVVLALVRRFTRTWPLWTALAGAALALVGSFVYPVLVEPLFNHFEPLPAGPLRSSIFELAHKEGVHIDDVLVADASRRTTTLNAYVSGIGSTRRVVVYDTLVRDLPREQAEVVVAHELGHAKHHDVAVGTVLGALGAAVGIGLLGVVLRDGWLRRLGVEGAGDPLVVPALLALVAVAGLLVSPVENTMSRAVEARADQVSLEATGERDAFVAMQRQLALRSLADPTPPAWSQFWFGSHPTVLQRIALGRG